MPPLLERKLSLEGEFAFCGVYLSREAVRNSKTKIFLFVLLLYLPVFLVSAVLVLILGFIHFPAKKIMVLICSYGIPLTLIPLLFYILGDGIVTYKGMLGLSIVSGIYTGIILSIFYFKKHTKNARHK